MNRIVLDTNIFISGFLWEGNEARLIRKIENNEVMNFISQEILEEIENVIKRDKFTELLDKARIKPDEIIEKIISISHMVVGLKMKGNIVKSDPADDKFIECAINSRSKYIVSGDNHLLNLKKYGNIQILTVPQMLKIINKKF